jgi:hypothetical protein
MTFVHVPRLADSAHAWHWPVHGESQHTPSTQKVLAHSLAVEQPLPFCTSKTHVVPAQ